MKPVTGVVTFRHVDVSLSATDLRPYLVRRSRFASTSLGYYTGTVLQQMRAVGHSVNFCVWLLGNTNFAYPSVNQVALMPFSNCFEQLNL